MRLPDGIGLDVAAPFGCGIQTGAGAVLTSLAAPAGSSIAIFGTGTVGLAAVMAARVAGCTTIIGVDVNPSRLGLALELGATHVIDASARGRAVADRGDRTRRRRLQPRDDASPSVFRQAVECTAPTGVCGLIGAAAFGTEASLDMNSILTMGRTIRGIVEGDSVPGLFLPRLVELWEQGRFPVDRLMTFYDFDRINEAVADAEAGTSVKPVLRMA